VYALSPVFRTVVGPNCAIGTPLNVVVDIAVKPVMVMVTLLPDAAVVGAIMVGALSTVTVVSAISVNPTVILNVYVPAATVDGIANVMPAATANEPSD